MNMERKDDMLLEEVDLEALSISIPAKRGGSLFAKRSSTAQKTVERTSQDDSNLAKDSPTLRLTKLWTKEVTSPSKTKRAEFTFFRQGSHPELEMDRDQVSSSPKDTVFKNSSETRGDEDDERHQMGENVSFERKISNLIRRDSFGKVCRDPQAKKRTSVISPNLRQSQIIEQSQAKNISDAEDDLEEEEDEIYESTIRNALENIEKQEKIRSKEIVGPDSSETKLLQNALTPENLKTLSLAESQ